jgi:hypothetical protein
MDCGPTNRENLALLLKVRCLAAGECINIILQLVLKRPPKRQNPHAILQEFTT